MDIMKNIFLFFVTVVHQWAVLKSFDPYDLPSSHMPFYFRTFTDELKKCYLNEECPYKDLDSEKLPCWGYEDNCQKQSAFSFPDCPSDSRGWTKTKNEQISTFYNQGDFGYIKQHRNSMRLMCEPTFRDDTALECSDHLQFCRGRNIFMNLSSILTSSAPFRYKMDVLSEGAFGGHCHLHKNRLMDQADHMSPLQSWAPEMRFFTEFTEKPITDGLCDIVVEKPTFIMKIDAAVNMYHHFCDFFNLYASLHVNMTHPLAFSKDVHIIIWETYPYKSNFADAWKAFTQNPVLNLRNFSGKTVCFKNVIFPLLPRMIFGLYYNTPLVYGCQKSGLFKAFSDFTLHRLKIKERMRNDSLVRVTLLSRQTTHRNILNEAELYEALNKNKSYDVRKTVFDKNLRFTDQLYIIRNTDIFIGMHGAGLTHLLFLPDWAGLFELYNCEDENCYKDLARLRGIKYITWEKEDKLLREDGGRHPDGRAHAKFTNYAFDVDEFLRLVSVLVQHVTQHPSFIAKLTGMRHDEL